MRAFFGVITLALLLVAEASAFVPGPTVIRECPKCRVPIEQPTMASGNTFVARFWSDGKMVAPMLPDYPWLVKCPKCKHLFWIDEAKKLGDTRKGWKGQGKFKPDELKLPTVSDFYNIVSKVKDKRKLRYIRNRLWHCANDPYRDKAPAGKISFSAPAKANMNALSRLLSEKNPEERLTKAEIAREFGQFDRCIKLLDTQFDRQCRDMASAIRMLARERYAPVMEFTRPSRYETRTGTATAKPTDIEGRLFARSMRESCVSVTNGLLARYGVNALLRGDPEQLRAAIKAGAAKGDDGAVAATLDAATAGGSREAACFLLDCGARINGRSGYPPVTPLMTACMCGNESVAKLLIDRGAHVNAATDYGMTPLTFACRDKSVSLAKLLIDAGANVNQGGAHNSPLMTVCTFTWDRPRGISKVDWANKTLEMVRLLIDNGANVNGVEQAGGSRGSDFWSTPLVEICGTQFPQDKFALDRYTNEEKSGCESVYLDIALLLLDSKADVNKSDSFGSSPLASAGEGGNVEMVKLLLDRGADVNKSSKDGTTPLSIASGLSDRSIEKLLLEHGAKPKTRK